MGLLYYDNRSLFSSKIIIIIDIVCIIVVSREFSDRHRLAAVVIACVSVLVLAFDRATATDRLSVISTHHQARLCAMSCSITFAE